MNLFKCLNISEIKKHKAFKYPFKGEHLKGIKIEIGFKTFGKDEIEYKARIHFDSGPTTVYQELETDSFFELLAEIEDFVKKMELAATLME